jgi:hypothetical protein
MSTRIRLIKPVETPPRDKAVFWMSEQGPFEQCQVAIERPEWATHWCTLPSIDGTVSGPVHSLAAQELPEPDKRIELRVRGIARYVRSMSNSVEDYGGLADAIMMLGPSFGCRSRGPAAPASVCVRCGAPYAATGSCSRYLEGCQGGRGEAPASPAPVLSDGTLVVEANDVGDLMRDMGQTAAHDNTVPAPDALLEAAREVVSADAAYSLGDADITVLLKAVARLGHAIAARKP